MHLPPTHPPPRPLPPPNPPHTHTHTHWHTGLGCDASPPLRCCSAPHVSSSRVNTYTHSSTFQCCSRDDAPDACLAGNRTGSYDYYSSYPSFRSDSLLDTYLSSPSAATCNWQYTSSLCPPHLLETCLGAGKLSW